MNEYVTSVYPRQQEFEYPIEGPRTETAKQIIENMGCILFEINNTVDGLKTGIISPDSVQVQNNTREPKEESLLDTMRRQRDLAEEILKSLCKIREALW